MTYDEALDILRKARARNAPLRDPGFYPVELQAALVVLLHLVERQEQADE